MGLRSQVKLIEKTIVERPLPASCGATNPPFTGKTA